MANVRGFCAAAAALLLLAMSTAPAQRPIGPPPAPSRPSTGADRDPGRSTATQRAHEDGERKIAKERVDGNQPAPEPPPPPDTPTDTQPRRPRPVDAGRAKEFLAMVRERALRVKSLEFDADVRVLAGDGASTSLTLSYMGRRESPELLQHRIAISEIAEGRTRLRDVVLVHEYIGERPQAWHLDKDGKPAVLTTDPFDLPLVAARPFRFIDVMPFEPARYRIEVDGEGERDGQPVVYLRAKPLIGRAEEVQLVVQRFNALVLRARVRAGDRTVWEAADSVMRMRDGAAGYEERRITHESGESSLVMQMTKRRVNGKIEPRWFDPAGFAP